MQANSEQTKFEKQQEQERRLKYKQELDMLIEIKTREKENLKRKKVNSNSMQNIEICENIERQQEEYRRKLQKESVKIALIQQLKKEEERKRQIIEDKNHFNRNLQESLNMQQSEIEMKKEMKLKGIIECKNQYIEYVEKKKKIQEEEEKYTKEVAEQEQLILIKLEDDNKQFMNRIRDERKRFEKIFSYYDQVRNDNEMKIKSIDYKFVEQGFLEKELKALEKERVELENKKNMKNEVNSTLQQQIENNRIKKEFLHFENLRLENEKINFEIQNHKVQVNQMKLNRKNQIQEMMKSLDRQIKEREQNLLGSNNLTPYEEEYNCIQKFDNQKVICPEKTVDSIPGFKVQQDRLKMNKICDKAMKQTDVYLQNELIKLKNDENNNNVWESGCKKHSNHRSVGIFGKTRMNFANDYEYLKYKKWHQNFDIISNKPVFNY